jgi:excisionase family DNA binding protein
MVLVLFLYYELVICIICEYSKEGENIMTAGANEEFMTLDEAADYVGIKRATFYNYMEDLKIRSVKFGRDRHGYLSRDDVMRIKEYKESPWKFKVTTRQRKEPLTV